MGAKLRVTPQSALRVVFDTNTVISALVFTHSSLGWLRLHWRNRGCVLLVSAVTVAELMRVLAYSKFRLSAERLLELQADYLPYCQTVNQTDKCPIQCRDVKDQSFLDLAQSGNADILVTGDEDLLALAGQTRFVIETPEQYLQRVSGAMQNL